MYCQTHYKDMDYLLKNKYPVFYRIRISHKTGQWSEG